MNQEEALACAVIRQAMDDINIYLRALRRNRIRSEEIGLKKHIDVIDAQRQGNFFIMHRNALCAASFLMGAEAYADVTRMWFEAAGLDFSKCREKAEAMFPLRQLLAM